MYHLFLCFAPFLSFCSRCVVCSVCDACMRLTDAPFCFATDIALLMQLPKLTYVYLILLTVYLILRSVFLFVFRDFLNFLFIMGLC